MQIEVDYCGNAKSVSRVKSRCALQLSSIRAWIGAIKYQGQLAALPVLCRALVARIKY